MRIAIIRSTLNKGSGQVVHIRELAQRFLKMGHQVTIFSREIKEQIEGVEVKKIDFLFDNIPFSRHFGFATKCGSKIQEYDVVHTQYHPGIFVGNFVRFMKDLPHIFTYHGFAPIRIWNNPKQKIKMIDHKFGTYFALRLGVDRIITVSNYLKKELIKSYRTPEKKIHAIYNGVDTKRFNPKVDGGIIRDRYEIGSAPLVLYVGRLAPYKGIHFLIKAIPHILKEVPNAKFLIAGSDRFEAIKISELIPNVRIRNKLIFTGYVPDEDIPRIYAACDVFCYPSLWEGFGLTPAEAQACGRPAVAFDHCAIPEVIENKGTGILVKPGKYRELASAISFLLNNEKERGQMGRKGIERVRRLFSWDSAAKNSIIVYEKAITTYQKNQ